MYTSEKIDTFIELRAQGWSLNHIASEIHVAKRTLVDWSREQAAQINSLRALLQETAQEKLATSREEELARLLRTQKDLEDELANRSLYRLPLDKLFGVAAELRQEIRDLRQEMDSAEQSRLGYPNANGQSRGLVPATNGTTGHH
jgi:chromosome segregation ATPase